MPNIKSQIKRDATNKAANEKNSAAKSEARTAAKKVETLVKEGKKEEAEQICREWEERCQDIYMTVMRKLLGEQGS